MIKKNVVLILLFMASLALAQTIPTPAVQFDINVSDGANNQNLSLGFDANGTVAFDGVELDQKAPPPPTSGNYDSRLSTVGIAPAADEDNYYVDTRDNETTLKTFFMSYKPASGQSTIVLSWDQADAQSKFSSLVIGDVASGGTNYTFDMLANNELDVSGTPLFSGFTREGNLLIFATPLAAPDFNADFSADVTTGPAPLTVNFSDASVQGDGGPIESWSWSFGDGTGSSLQNPVKTYGSPGIYTVSLTVTDASGATDTEIKTQYVTVTAAPQVQFTADVTSGPAPLTVNFTDETSAQGGATLTSWSWDFGDGATSTAQNPSHTYSAAGYYDVTLTVTDNNSSSSSLTKTDYIKVAISTPNSYDLTFNVSDGVNGQDLTIGNNAEGTDGFDFGLDQNAPPNPPSGNFFANLILDGGNLVYTDIRDDNILSEKTFVVDYSAESGQGPIVLTWNPADLPTDVRLEIQDLSGTGAFSLDMSTASSLDISTAGGALDGGLLIVQQPGVNVFASVVGPAIPEVTIQDECTFKVMIQVDMSISPDPNQRLGSYTGTLNYAEARLNVLEVSEIMDDFTGNVVVDYATGLITFNGARTDGKGNIVNILEVEFETLNGNPSTLDLEFSAMAAARTFESLLPKLEVTDLSVDPVNEDVLLGDVNADGLVNSTDALIVLSYDAGMNVQNQLARINAGVGDVNRDGVTNSTDALIILSYDVGLTVFSPVGEKYCF